MSSVGPYLDAKPRRLTSKSRVDGNDAAVSATQGLENLVDDELKAATMASPQAWDGGLFLNQRSKSAK